MNTKIFQKYSMPKEKLTKDSMKRQSGQRHNEFLSDETKN